MVRWGADSDVFCAVADPTRRRMLGLLAGGELAAGELAAHFDMRQPSVSEHLRVLREAGLVRTRKEGRKHIYRLNASPLRGLSEWVKEFERFWDERLDRLEKYLRKKHGGPEKR